MDKIAVDKKSWDELKNVDVRTVDRDSLVDISDIRIDDKLPVDKRISKFVEAVKNPYCFKVGEVVVKVDFNNAGNTFEENFENMLLALN